VVFTRVCLAEACANAWPIKSHQDEEILRDEPEFAKLVDQLNVCQPLLIGAHLIPALDYVNALFAQDTSSLLRCAKIEVEHGFVILFRGSVLGLVVAVIVLVVLVFRVSRPARGVHVWGVEDNAINGVTPVWETGTIDTGLYIRAE